MLYHAYFHPADMLFQTSERMHVASKNVEHLINLQFFNIRYVFVIQEVFLLILYIKNLVLKFNDYKIPKLLYQHELIHLMDSKHGHFLQQI